MQPGSGERGSILVLVLVVTAALLFLGGALLIVTLTENKIARNQERDLKLYYITEAGIEAGVALLGSSAELPGGFVGGGHYRIEIVGEPGLPQEHPYYEKLPQRLEGGRRLVISTGSLNGSVMVMAVLVESAAVPLPGEPFAAADCNEENNGNEGVVIAEWIKPWRP